MRVILHAFLVMFLMVLTNGVGAQSDSVSQQLRQSIREMLLDRSNVSMEKALVFGETHVQPELEGEGMYESKYYWGMIQTMTAYRVKYAGYQGGEDSVFSNYIIRANDAFKFASLSGQTSQLMADQQLKRQLLNGWVLKSKSEEIWNKYSFRGWLVMLKEISAQKIQYERQTSLDNWIERTAWFNNYCWYGRWLDIERAFYLAVGGKKGEALAYLKSARSSSADAGCPEGTWHLNRQISSLYLNIDDPERQLAAVYIRQALKDASHVNAAAVLVETDNNRYMNGIQILLKLNMEKDIINSAKRALVFEERESEMYRQQYGKEMEFTKGAILEAALIKEGRIDLWEQVLASRQ